MQYTENHNFKLPDGTDRFNIQNENDNWESMDTLIDEYLPLSAGPDNPLTGRLYIDRIMDGTSASSTGIHIQKNGVSRASVYGYYYEDGSANSDFVALVCRNGLGEILNGIRIYEAGNIHIGAAVTGTEQSPVGGSILLRPYGIGDNTNQAYLNRDGEWHISGQQVGGHPMTYSDKSLAISGSSLSTYVTMQTLSFGVGTWLILSYMDTNSSATTTYNHRVAVSNGYDKTVRNSMASGGGSLNGQMFRVSSGTVTVTIYTYTSTATTVRNTAWYVRLQ